MSAALYHREQIPSLLHYSLRIRKVDRRLSSAARSLHWVRKLVPLCGFLGPFFAVTRVLELFLLLVFLPILRRAAVTYLMSFRLRGPYNSHTTFITTR